jgi:hypothetical protein
MPVPIRASLAGAGVLVLTVAASTQASSAESTIRERFGTRDPVTCQSYKEPKTGPISADQAKQYFKCALEVKGSVEGTNGQVFIVEDLVLEVGKEVAPGSVRILDAAAESPLYPIKGSFVLYGCTAISTTPMTYNKGKNCTVKTQPNASGWCYKTINDDWRCDMVDTRNRTVQMELPPPASR